MTLDLSKKRHYTFPQLASRLRCSEEDLRYFVMEGELTPSRFLETGHYRQYQMEPHEDYGSTGDVSPSAMCDACEPDDDVIQRGWLYGFHYLVLPNRTSGNQCEFRFAATFPSGFDLGDIIYELDASIGIDEVMNNGFVMAVELDRFEALKSSARKPTGLGKSLTTSEINSLLELVIGMAIQGYRYDPAEKRNTSTKDIANDLAALGIKIDDGTVRKYLKLAAATVLPIKPPQQ